MPPYGVAQQQGALRGDRQAVPVDRVERGERVAEDGEVLGPRRHPLVEVPAVDGGAGEGHVGQRLGLFEQVADQRVPQVLTGEADEVVVLLGRPAAARAAQGDDPPALLDGQQEARAAGPAVPPVGLDVDDREAVAGRGGGEIQAAGVRQARVDLASLCRGQAEGGQPVGGLGAAARGVDDQVRVEGPLGAVVGPDPYARDRGVRAGQAHRLRALDDLDPLVGQDPRADRRVQQVPAGQDHVVGLGPAPEPASCAQGDDVRRDRPPVRPGLPERPGDPGQQVLHGPRPARPEHVGVPCLRQSLAGSGSGGQRVALHDDDPVGDIGQRACREHAAVGSPQDDGGSGGGGAVSHARAFSLPGAAARERTASMWSR